MTFSSLNLDFAIFTIMHAVQAGENIWQAVKIDTLVKVASALMKDDPFALLCNEIHCPRCNLVRDSIKAQYARQWQSER